MNITPEIVAKVANQLMKANGCTTTLDVKKRLRQMGYIAFQQEVSAMMDELCIAQWWIFEFNGLFRIYRKPTPTQWVLLLSPPLSMN